MLLLVSSLDIWSHNGDRNQPQLDIRHIEDEVPDHYQESQILNGHLAALNRSLSRSTDKYKPFFLTIRTKGIDFY